MAQCKYKSREAGSIRRGSGVELGGDGTLYKVDGRLREGLNKTATALPQVVSARDRIVLLFR